MLQYTKGEWKLDKVSSFRYVLYPNGRDNAYVIAEINSGVSRHTKLTPNEGEANANLIAASPLLYEALKALMEEYQNVVPYNRIDTFLLETVDNALAKAEGKGS